MRSIQLDMNRDLGDKRIMNINQRRSFFQHITLLSLGILGAAFLGEKVINDSYFKIGFYSLITCDALVLFWMREIIDEESTQLQLLQDKYNILSEEKIALIDQYKSKQFDSSIMEKYLQDLQELPSAKELMRDVVEEREKRAERKNQPMDYFGEIIVLFFMIGLFFLILSLTSFTIDYLRGSLIIVFFFFLSFTDFLLPANAFLSRFVSYLKQKLK